MGLLRDFRKDNRRVDELERRTDRLEAIVKRLRLRGITNLHEFRKKDDRRAIEIDALEQRVNILENGDGDESA